MATLTVVSEQFHADIAALTTWRDRLHSLLADCPELAAAVHRLPEIR